MSTGEPDDCICGRTISGGGTCPVHKQDFLQTPDTINASVDPIRRYMTHEQEAEFRAMIRNVYTREGMMALWQIIGEMVASMTVVNDIIGEILEEKEKGK